MNPNSGRQKVGLVLAGLISLTSVPSVLTPTPDGEVGPPLGILVLSTVLGIVGFVGVFPAWRGSSLALRVVAGALVVSVLSSLPALFVDIPVWLKLAAGVGIALSIVALILMFSPARRPVPVLD